VNAVPITSGAATVRAALASISHVIFYRAELDVVLDVRKEEQIRN
jgi:hypothetical protein